jgi:hypothetical protein
VPSADMVNSVEAWKKSEEDADVSRAEIQATFRDRKNVVRSYKTTSC